MRLAPTSFSTCLRQRNWLFVVVLIIVSLLIAILSFPRSSEAKRRQSSASATPDREQNAKVLETYGKIPMSFELNQGQAHRRVKYVARGSGYSVFLTGNEAVFALKNLSEEQSVSTLRMKLIGSSGNPRVEGLDKLQGVANYFIGNKTREWQTSIATFSRVKYENVYKGIDIIYHGSQNQLEYDFVVAPGVSPNKIQVRFDGTEKIWIDKDGKLVLKLNGKEIRQSKPIAYQTTNGERREIEVSYRTRGGSVGFTVGDYDKTQSLVIDPVLLYSTYLGGTAVDQGFAIAVDSLGQAFLTGNTTSTDFPLGNSFQPVKGTFTDAFVVKLNAAGNGIVYSTYLGGNGDDSGLGIAVDSQGNAYVTGLTGSGSFPTLGAFQSSKDALLDSFLTKLNPSGSALVYSTFFGGNNNETLYSVAVDSSGSAYVAGRTDSTRWFNNFPAFQPRHGNPLYLSTNSAGQWSASSNGIVPIIVFDITQDPVTASTIYAGTSSGVYKSLDHGVNWTATGSGSATTIPMVTNAVAIDPSTPSTIYAATNSGVFKSVDAGASYTVKNSGLGNTRVLSFAIDPTSPQTLYAGTNSGVFRSTNGGDSWSSWSSGITALSAINEIVLNPTNSQILYVGTSNGVFRSTTGGAGWFSMNTGITNGAPITAMVIDPTTPTILYAAAQGASSPVYKTTTSGSSWTPSGTGLSVVINGQPTSVFTHEFAIDPSNPTILYAATASGGVFKTSDGGSNWSQSNTGLSNAQTPAITVDRITPARLYVGTNIGTDAIIAKFDPSGFIPEYLINFGGDESDEARGIAVDSSDNAYVVGTTSSGNFPTVNAFDSTHNGLADVFVTKFNSGSTMDYSTFLGGGLREEGRAIAVRSGNAHVTGFTSSANFPMANAFDSTLSPSDPDAFVTKLGTSGSTLEFSTFLGGVGLDQGFGIAVDGSGVYVTGETQSLEFPVLDAPQSVAPGAPNSNSNAFVTKLNPAGSNLVYSTYLGGANSDFGAGIAVDPAGNAYVVGTTSSTDFPTANAFQTNLKTATDAFVTKIGLGADLSITKTDARDPVMVNNALRYFLRVDNAGPSNATNVVVTDTLPAGVTFVSATPTQGSCSFSSPTVTCQLGTVNSGSSTTIILTTTVASAGVITNTASVAAQEADSNPANNTSTQTTTISTSPSISGFVRDSLGNAISGVLMTLSGTQSATTTTDANGRYQFASVQINGNYVVTPSKTNYTFDPTSLSFTNITLDSPGDFVGTPILVQFSQPTFTVNEGTETVQISVTRTGSTAGVSTVEYTTVNGTASDRSDFTAALGTLRFEAGETSKSFQVLITDDVFVEGTQGFNVVLSNATGANLAGPSDPLPSTALVTISDNDAQPGAPNPIDDSTFFVRQHYHDFLNRAPDQGGLDFWVSGIESCGSNAQCREVKRIDTSAAFFLSIEFQSTGYLVYRMYKSAYGDTASPNVAISVPVIRLNEFLADSQKVGEGVVVGVGNWQQQLEANKTALGLSFVQRQRFLVAFPLAMTADQFVNKLDQNAGGVLSDSERTQLIATLSSAPGDPVKRAEVFRAVSEDNDLQQREFNRAFVLMQYFGYLRRNPDDSPDTDFRGWEFWLNKLNQFGNFRDAEMVKAFINSIEYRGRFAP